jgi:outer membrane protein assembly factor BamB
MFADGPAHNSVNRAESTLSPANVSGLRIVRTYPKWKPNPVPAYQIVVGNLGYSAMWYTSVAAVKLLSGGRAWSQPIFHPRTSWRYVPAVSNGVLFVGGDSAMYAFDAATGHPLWTTSVKPYSWFNEVTVASGIVYADTYYGGTVYAFDPVSGRVLWSVVPPCCLTGAVTVSGGLAYITAGSNLIAYNVRSGAQVFAVPTAGQADTVAVSGGVVFLQSVNQLQAFKATTGALLWSSVTVSGNSGSQLTPAVDGSTVVVATQRYVMAFAAKTGRRLWTVDGGLDLSNYSIPSIANGVVYAGSLANGLQAVRESDGVILYTGGQGCWNAVVSHGSVYAYCMGSGGGVTVFSL